MVTTQTLLLRQRPRNSPRTCDVDATRVTQRKASQNLLILTSVTTSLMLESTSIIKSTPIELKYWPIPLLDKTEQALSSTQSPTTPNPLPFDDFTLFTSKKRKEDELDEIHSNKKNKTQDNKDENFEMVQN
jgi:hypothetical protein